MRSRLVSLILAFTGIVVACSSNDAKPKKLCVANKASYCRCQDREQGEKTCAADGNSYGPCIPCERPDNPQIDYEPTGPGDLDDDDDFDGGFELPEDSGQSENPRCGDGKVQVGEDCDDKNKAEDDGCNSDCKLAGASPQPSNSCPGLNVDVWGGGHKPTLTSSTGGGGAHATKTDCNAAGSSVTRGGAANDRVFHVTAHKSGTMKVETTDASYNVFLYVAETCADTVMHSTCVNKLDAVGAETLSFAVNDGQAYTVFVDGDSTAGGTGNFKVTFSIE